MSGLPHLVGESICRHRIFSRRQRILVAVSGGLDSMVLLQVLHHLAGENGWDLTVAHLNHLLRGASSRADERLVRRTATQLGIRAVVEKADVRALAREHRVSLEMAARAARHQFLARTATRLGIRSVALAHHADDQLELFFLRLLRGSGGEGLAGMKWRSRSAFDGRVELARPFLDTSKAALQQYAKSQKIPFREDASNRSLEMLRNRIRHELLPLLRRRYQPAVADTVKRAAEISRAESEFASEEAAKWLAAMRRRSGRAPVAFARLHAAVQRRCLFRQLLELGFVPDFQLVERLRVFSGQAVAVAGRIPAFELGGTKKVSRGAAEAVGACAVFRTEAGLLRRVTAPGPLFEQHSLACDLGRGAGEVQFSGIKVRWKVEREAGSDRGKTMAGRELFDADKVGSQVVLRHWALGDRFQPIGLHGSVKLQDFFTNNRVPRGLRHKLLLATTAEGEVFWVEGMRIAERFKLTNCTTRRLNWSWQRSCAR